MRRLLLLAAILSLLSLSESTLAQQATNQDSSGSSSRPSQRPEPDSASALFSRQAVVWQVDASRLEEAISEDIVDFGLLLPGVSFLDQGSLSQSSPLTLRGTTPQEVAISLNGMRLREPLNGFVSSAVPPINLVETLSLRGLESFSGSGRPTVGGTLEITTLLPDFSRPYSRVQFRAGDWGYSDIGLSLGVPVTKSLGILFSGSRQELDGFFGQRRDVVDSRLFNTLIYRPNPAFEVKSVTLFNRNEIGVPAPVIPDLVPNLFNPARKETRFDQQVSAKWRGAFGESSQLEGKLFFSRDRRESFSDTVLFDTKSKSFGAGFENHFHFSALNIAFGGEIDVDKLDSEQLPNQTEAIAQGFFHGSYAIGAFDFGGEVRLEKHPDYAAQVTPSLHVNLYWQGGRFWLGAQRATRYPTFAERFWQSLFYSGNQALSEESSAAAEVGFSFSPGASYQIKSTAFVNRVSDWIGNARKNSGFGPVNFDHRTTGGVDLELTWNYQNGGAVGLAGNYLLVADAETETELQVPEYFVNTYVQQGFPLFEKFVYVKLRGNARVLGKRFGWFYPSGAALPLFDKRGSKVVFDAKISLVFADATVNFSWENIFDQSTFVETTLVEDYQLVPGFSMPPRTLRFGIDWQFWD